MDIPLKVHENAILVTDKVLAVALFANDHRAKMTLEQNRKFYCVFAITKRLRKDIRRFYADDLNVNSKSLMQDLDELNGYIYDQKCAIQHELELLYPAT